MWIESPCMVTRSSVPPLRANRFPSLADTLHQTLAQGESVALRSASRQAATAEFPGHSLKSIDVEQLILQTQVCRAMAGVAAWRG